MSILASIGALVVIAIAVVLLHVWLTWGEDDDIISFDRHGEP